MAINIPGLQRQSRPVSSFYEGKALRLSQRQGEQNLQIGEQERQLNELKLEALRNPQPEEPDPQDLVRLQEFSEGEGKRLNDLYSSIAENAGEERALEIVRGEAQRSRDALREQFPVIAPYISDGEWNPAPLEEEEEENSPWAKLNPSQYTQESRAIFEQTGKFSDLVRVDTNRDSQRDEKIADLISQGVPEDRAQRLVDNLERIEMTDVGTIRLVDEVNNTAVEIPVQALSDEPTMSAAPEPGRSLYDLAQFATGVGSGMVQGYNIVGGIAGMNVESRVAQARQILATEQQNLIRALSINRRFPATEMERIREEVNISPRLLDNPQLMRDRMFAIDESLNRRMENAIRDSNDTQLSETVRADARSAARDIENFLAILGVKPVREAQQRAMQYPGFEDLSTSEQQRLIQLEYQDAYSR